MFTINLFTVNENILKPVGSKENGKYEILGQNGNRMCHNGASAYFLL